MQIKITKTDKQIYSMSGISTKKISNKEIIIFDMDGTLTKSKSVVDKKMACLICQLLDKKIVAVISGADFSQFKKQFLEH